MKQQSILLFIFCVFACTNYSKDELLESIVSPSAATKAVEAETYAVTQFDIDSYINYMSRCHEEDGLIVRSISPIERDGRIVCYVVNYDDGWQIVSADKRGPIVLAECDSGSFSWGDANDEEAAWLECTTTQILDRIVSPDVYYSKLSETGKKKEDNCMLFWQTITSCPFSATKASQDSPAKTRSFEVDSLLQFFHLTLTQESIYHLIPTYWHQQDPFNDYCPFISDSSSVRCPAGCVALSASQTLYYLHNKLQLPLLSPTSGLCTGWYGNYTQTFGALSSAVWENMSYSTDPDGYAALLIGYAGKALNMNYGPTGSSAYTSHIPAFFNNYFGIGSTYGTYDEDLVYDSIHNEYPVICRASSSAGGHSFIIDGVRVTVPEDHYIYLLPSGETYEFTIVLDPVLQWRINWGWGTTGRNALYASGGSWLGFDNNRNIVYGFHSNN